MAFIYEVNGQKVEFDKEPTDADIDEAALSLGSSKAKPKSNMPKPVEGSGGAAFGVYRPAGRRPDSQNDREASAEMGLQTARGVASNIPALAGIPGTAINAVANAPRTAQDVSNRYQRAQEAFTGQAPQEQPLPEYNQVTPYDMNYFAQLTPGPQPSSPQGQLAFSAGQMVGAPIVPPVLKAAAPAARATYNLGKDVADLAMHPIQTAKTGMEAFGRGYASPMGTAENTALMPIRPTYYPHEQVAEFQAGTRPATQMTEAPTSNLISTPTQKWAQNMAPTNSAGQPLVAPAGRGFEGYMENLGSTYKQNPYMAAIDAATGLGGMALTGGFPTPVSAIGKSIPALAARTLQGATQFEPGFNAAAVQAMQARAGLEANMPPSTPALPAPGPVAPTLYANQAGEVTGKGGTSVPQQLPSAGKTTPKETAMNLAASKLQPVEPTPSVSPAQQADWAARSGGGYTPPANQAPAPIPKTGPVAPTELPTETLTVTPNVKAEPLPTDSLLQKNRQITTEEGKALAKKAKLDEKAKAAGKEVKSEPVHPEVERIAKEAEQSTPEYIKSLDLDKKTLAEKESIKQTLIEEERKLKAALRDNKTTKVYNNDEVEALMKRYHAVSKARDVIQNESVKLTNSEQALNRLKAEVSKIDEHNNNPKNKKNQKSYPDWATPDKVQQLEDIISNIKRNESADVSSPSKKGPSNVSQMLIDEPKGSSHYPNKEEFEKARIFSTLKDKAHTGSYVEGDKIIHVEEINYGNLPKDITSTWEQTKTYAKDKDGNRVSVGKEWTELDPEPLSSQLKKRFNGNKK